MNESNAYKNTMPHAPPEPSGFLGQAASIRDQLVYHRRSFHAHPELGLDCHRTAGVVQDHLTELGLKVQTGLASTGVTGLLEGIQPGPVIALRADMDALPITEQTGLSFSSQNKRVMHACAHDGHTAIVLGTATLLSKIREQLPGSVKFIFQPGEEAPGGAGLMIDQGVLKNPDVQAIIGFHIYPMIASGSIAICSGTVTAGCCDFEISLQGKGGHASKPNECIDPIQAAGQLIIALQSILSRRLDPFEPAVLTLSEINSHGGYNIIPENVSLKGTFRFLNQKTKELILDNIGDILKGIESAFGVSTVLSLKTEEPPLSVAGTLAQAALAAAKELLSADQVQKIQKPSMGAEDFARFAQEVPSAYFRLGCFDQELGHTHGLHSPEFDFDEQILVQGTAYAAYLIWKLLFSLQSKE
ncbi:MAG: amidohydrolase [Desulfohalobiaceae bacterium]|nr:amidohydrolase [Desulfohalobiaceae bacterium]